MQRANPSWAQFSARPRVKPRTYFHVGEAHVPLAGGGELSTVTAGGPKCGGGRDRVEQLLALDSFRVASRSRTNSPSSMLRETPAARTTAASTSIGASSAPAL
jgi:hypothetical protein